MCEKCEQARAEYFEAEQQAHDKFNAREISWGQYLELSRLAWLKYRKARWANHPPEARE
jgi:hypothetical protein